MQLTHLFDAELWYVGEGAWAYDPLGAAGYGEGEGIVRGDRIRGSLRWSNRPRRRSDGAWLPDLCGFIRTLDGVAVLFTLRGVSLPESEPGELRSVVCSLMFECPDESYRWLNPIVAAVEARFDPVTGRMMARAWECVNDLPVAVAPG